MDLNEVSSERCSAGEAGRAGSEESTGTSTEKDLQSLGYKRGIVFNIPISSQFYFCVFYLVFNIYPFKLIEID